MSGRRKGPGGGELAEPRPPGGSLMRRSSFPGVSARLDGHGERQEQFRRPPYEGSALTAAVPGPWPVTRRALPS
jgi:hypothetical protein